MNDQMPKTDIENALERLEDYTLTSNLTRCQNYQAIQINLEVGCNVTDSMVKRLLVVCSHDLKHNMRFANILTIISLILKKFKDGECTPLPEVTQSALSVLRMMKTIVSLNKTQALQKLCFDTFQLYPDDVYTELVKENCPDIIETVYLYLQNAVAISLRLMIFTMLHKILQVLPPSIRLAFVKENVTLWFSRVIPSIMGLIASNKEMVTALDVLELLTEDLEKIDYTENDKWQNVLECIYSPQKYPAVMKALMNDEEDTWARIWKVLVKLLKQQITMSKAKVGSPINSMLPIVELAFKLGATNRVRAFQCWNVLIDNFSMETNEHLINKRVKLLVIPLKSNNAKVEDVALAKFYTWWHLIQKYHSRMGSLAEMVFVPFLHYCFGNPKVSAEKNATTPGQISEKLKKLCMQAFVESVGHMDCDSCLPNTEIPKLPKKILTPKLLLNHLADWLHALKATVKLILAENDSEQGTKQIKCMWKSFLVMTSKYPENDRKFVTRELLVLLTQLVKSKPLDKAALNLVYNDMLPSFFNEVQLKHLLVSKDIQKTTVGPLHKVVTLMLQPELYTFYPSSAPESSLRELKPITLAVVDKSLSSPNDMVEYVIEELPSNDNGLMFWTSLVESIKESECDVEVENLKKLLLWPLKNMEHFQHVQHPASVWNNSYTSMRSRLNQTTIEKDISMILLTTKDTSSTNQFCLYALLQIIKDVLESPNNTDSKMEAEFLINILSKIKDYESVSSVMPVIVDSLVLMLTKASEGNDHSLTEFALKAASYTLKIVVESKELGDNERQNILMQLLKPINKLFTDNANVKFKGVVLDQLIACSFAFGKDHEGKDIVLSILKTFLSKSKETEVPLYSTVQNAITAIEKGEVNTELEQKDKFSAPKASAKKTKKKTPSILNTIVDNGEDYVVLNTHWKFDPKKLTENQKEKLQRKREDIPALYQDLSQSQDEFKLTSWKTDSQDTTVSNSTSKSTKENDDASTILKAMPCTDVVPKIMENIFSDSAKEVPKEPQIDKTDNENVMNIDIRSPKINKLCSLSTSKRPRSPRVALKDRVFQNVKVLIEKSTITEDVPITPPPKSANDTINAYSAPPKLSSNRPSRVKRRPRKFSTDFLLDSTDSDGLRCSSPSNVDKNKEELISNKDCELKSRKTSGQEIKNKKSDNSNKTVRTTIIKRRKHSVAVNDSQESQDASDASKKHVNKVDKVKPTDKKTGELEIDDKNTIANKTPTKRRRHSVMVSDSQNDQNSSDADIPRCSSEFFVNKEAHKTIAFEVTVEETSELENDNINKIDDSSEKSLKNAKTLDADVSTCDIIVIDDEQESADNSTEKLKSTEPEAKSMKIVEPISDDTVQKYTASQDEISTPAKTDKSKDTDKSKSTVRKPKKSRIEKELAIDMVEGHPLFKAQSEIRTRKSIIGTVCGNRRKALTEKLSKLSQSDSKIVAKHQRKQDRDSHKSVEKPKNDVVKELFSVKETQDNFSTSTDASDLPMSEDFIESSQDTTISVISTKSSAKKKSKVDLANLQGLVKNDKKATDTQGSVDNSSNTSTDILLTNDETKDDIEFSQNKSVPQENELKDLTAEMDTEPFNDLTAKMDTEPFVEKEATSSDDVTIINDDPEPIEINTEDLVVVSDTQNTPNADTEPLDPNQFAENGQTEDFTPELVESTQSVVTEAQIHKTTPQTDTPNADTLPMETEQNETTLTISGSDAECGLSSPFKDDERRNQDFLNNTLEISPIKTLSPIPDDKKHGSPENSSDYVVIRLASPVSSDGEPFEKSGSPEIFTEDKISPDKRDQSPPREEVIINNSSPSSSLSLKKNRPQMRPGNRAAQMLGLCVPDRLQTFMNPEKPTESEETKKSSTITTPVRRNLRILYNNGDNMENSDENENNEQNSENFLKFKRTIPSADSSPSVPILKRKFTEIDDCAMSPASKRKRVSFHDPPVSTTIAVQKYIEPLGVRSPQTSASKKIERQTRCANMKSPKKLENVFKLDTALIKTVESFTETTLNSEDIDMSSLEQTPSVEIVKTSELNDTDPICPELSSCLDPISNIASELSSPAMKNLLIEELEGKVETIGDLAKLTELEVNRLCIKAPKVQVAKKVLFDYAEILKHNTESLDTSTVIIEDVPDEIPVEKEIVIPGIDVEAQTEEVKLEDTGMQTDKKEFMAIQTQTIETLTKSSMSQTEESGSKSTKDIVKSCLERQDFIEELIEQLDIPAKTKIMAVLPLDAIANVIGKKMDESNSKRMLDCVIDGQETAPTTENKDKNRGLQFLVTYLGKKYCPKDLIYVCRGLMDTAHDNMDKST